MKIFYVCENISWSLNNSMKHIEHTGSLVKHATFFGTRANLIIATAHSLSMPPVGPIGFTRCIPNFNTQAPESRGGGALKYGTVTKSSNDQKF